MSEPLVAELDTVCSAVQLPQVLPSEESLYWISYEDIALFVPADAPLHESVVVVSTIVAAVLKVVGAEQDEVRLAQLMVSTTCVRSFLPLKDIYLDVLDPASINKQLLAPLPRESISAVEIEMLFAPCPALIV